MGNLGQLNVERRTNLQTDGAHNTTTEIYYVKDSIKTQFNICVNTKGKLYATQKHADSRKHVYKIATGMVTHFMVIQIVSFIVLEIYTPSVFSNAATM